jgi:hypothetical protein
MNYLEIMIILFLFIILFPSKAFAYIDPGTGSMLIQLAIALVASVLFYFRKRVRIFLNWFKKKIGLGQ